MNEYNQRVSENNITCFGAEPPGIKKKKVKHVLVVVFSTFPLISIQPVKRKQFMLDG